MPQGPWLTGDEMTTWRALDRLLNRLPGAIEAQLERDADLSLMEYDVMAALSEQPGHAIRISRLAELAHCELSRLSHLVSRLERRELLRRSPDTEDRRYTLAILTETGLEHLVATAPGHVDTVRRLVFDALTPSEQGALRDTCTALVARLDELDV